MADGSVIIDIRGDDSNIKKTLQGVEGDAKSAGNSLDNLGDSAEGAGKGFNSADVAIGTFVGNGLAQLASKAGEVIGQIAALADETREYREDMAKLDTAFTTAGHSTETANEAYSSFYRILGESDRSVEAVNHLAELTKNEQEIAQWGTIAAGVTAKFGDSLPIEGLTEAANETAKVGKVTGPLADALTWAGISEDEFNKKLEKCNSEQERASLITSTLNNEYSAAAEEYNKLTANTQAARDATNNMEQAQAALGAAIEPVTTAWTNMKANALQWFVDTGLPALQTGWQWVKDNLPAIAVIVGGLTAAWLAFGGAQTILNAVQTAGTAIQWALNVAMNANPIGLIILAITALVAGFMILWNNCEGFRNFWIDLWEKIKDAAQVVADWFKNAWSVTIEWLKGAVAKIKDFFAAAWNGIKNAFSAVGSFFSGIWNTIKGIFSVVKDVLSGFFSNAWNAIKSIWSAVTGFFGGIWDGIKGIFSSIGSWFSQTFTKAKNAILSVFSNIGAKFNEVKNKIFNAFSNIKDKFLSIGKNIVEGIWNGISNGMAWIKKKIKEWVGNVVKFCKKILGIKSPSRVFRDEVGAMISEGMALGIEDNAKMSYKAIQDVINPVIKYAKDASKETVKTVKDYNKEIAQLDKQRLEDRKKENADLEAIEKTHAENVAKIREEIKTTITKQMTNLNDLTQSYTEKGRQLWEDYDNTVSQLISDYESQLASKTQSIADSLDLWNKAEKNAVTGKDLTENLKSQVEMLEDFNTAITSLEGRNIDTDFVQALKEMGVAATGEIEALNQMTDEELTDYVKLWQEKNSLAEQAAVEELEPLKAETMKKIDELTTETVTAYEKLREDYKKEATLLVTELKQSMIDAGDAGYNEILGQLDDYTDAGAALMDGIISGITYKSPEVADAVSNAVRGAIEAGKDEAEIKSPSKVMKKEIGYNLADGLNVGWNEKITAIKNQMAYDMQGLITRIKTVVGAENARMGQGVGVADTGFSDIAHAVGMQTAGINSLASEYRKGTNTQTTIPLILNGRELGRAIVDVLQDETTRTGISLA